MNNRQRRAAKRRQRKAGGPPPGGRQHRAGAARAGGHDPAPDEMIAFAVEHVWPDRHPAALVGVEVLAEAAAVPQARREISWCLSGWLTRGMRDAWARGWQPADLPRLAARELSEAHRDVCRDAIALEARTYLGGPREPDPDWLGQLEDLGALDAPWGDEDLLDDRARTTPAATFLLRVVELLALLARLPDQPVLMPPPSQWGRTRPSTGSPAVGDDRVLARVRALLAKAESTEFPDEAEALSAKAQELISRHAVDRAALVADEPRPVDVAGRRIPVDNPYPQPKSALLGTVATANRAKAVWSVHFGFSTVFGTPDDLAAVELLYTSLLAQATAAMLAAGSADRRRRLPSFRESFLGAYALRVGERLLEATDAAVGDGVARHGDALLPRAGATFERGGWGRRRRLPPDRPELSPQPKRRRLGRRAGRRRAGPARALWRG